MSIFLKANWEHIIMANYEIAPEILEPFLPKGVELDLFNGKCYISLVGFMFKNTKLFTIPIPFFGNFEEINLRFYVKRIEKDKSIKRGVVFINETIPYPVVAWVANKLYNENYTVVQTKHTINTLSNFQNITFKWLVDKNWNSIFVKAENTAAAMTENSLEKFIYEHYYGYTKINEYQTEEYKLQHPSWKTHEVIDYRINCDFEKMYGKYFSVLDNTKPTAVFIAEGSEVAIEWKRNRLNL
ncbi:MAG: DUF2071 domain-containing protein [Flavobacterium sp.]|nr:DUF2071 domain-containing protein [Flavobacterium sp.]